MREVQAVTSKHSSITTISYEALCTDADEAIDMILKHCDLEPDHAVNEYARHALHGAPKYSDLELMPELVQPFKNTLIDMGYTRSVSRVQRRI
jgi:hypothetical protein